MSKWPLLMAMSSALVLSLALIRLTLAPASTSAFTASAWPWRAA